jgi:hypothetical protein
MLHRRSGEVHLYGELLQGLEMRLGGGWSELLMATTRKGRKTGEEAVLTGGRWLVGCHGWDGSVSAWRLPMLVAAERSRACERRDGGGRMHARSKAGVPASNVACSGSASCA